MAKYFFDTTVLIAFFKREDSKTHDLFSEILDGGSSATISVITLAEAYSWSEMTDETIRRDRQAILALLQVIDVNRSMAQRAGGLRRQHNLELPDALIAACAERAGGKFFSKDAHFNRLLDSGILDGEIYA